MHPKRRAATLWVCPPQLAVFGPHLAVCTALLAICASLALSSCSQRAVAAVQGGFPAVTDRMLVDAATSDGSLMYLRSYNGQNHAPFSEIDTKNVARLEEVFTHTVSLPEGFESPPMVDGRTMIVTTPLDRVYALDAVTGRQLWEYDYPVVKRQLRTVCCDMVNRGVALYGTMAYLATLDNHVIALDARTGAVAWDKAVYPDPGAGYAMTLAPLAVDGKIVVGESGGEYGIRGFITALDPSDGHEIWKRYTIPAPGEPNGNTYPPGKYLHGGGGAWLTGTYDPETKTLYWGVGNPGPWFARERPGRNLYSDSVLALDVATGKIKWYFQQTPHDTWDYDATNTPVLAEVTIAGRPRKILYQAARNGWFYVIDRTNGKLVSMTAFTKTTSVTGYDRKHDIGTVDASKYPGVGKAVFTCPAFFGGDNWWPYSFDPQTGYAYVPTMKTCMTLEATKPVPFVPGATYTDEAWTVRHVPGESGWGELQAIDVATGKRMWHMDTALPWNDGTLSTDGGLVFSGTPDGKFFAFDARTGKILWEHHMTSGVIGVPMSYRVDGKQYVAVQSGWGGVAPFYGGPIMNKSFQHFRLGGRLYVFALPAPGATQ
jgi:alcohol dehydrogenase (cytochrome c)